MERIGLKKTELQVSPFALGTADYGTKYSEVTAFLQMDAYVDGGGNFIDTAHVYGSWITGMGNISERVIGSWMKERGNRNRIIVSTKGAHPPLENMKNSRVNPTEIVKDMENSLRGLQTDYIDLYFLHRDNPTIPAVEILGCMEEQVNKGNIRYYGCSNWSLSRIIEAQQVAERENLKGFVCNQLMYSLATADKDKLWDSTLVMMDEATYQNHLQKEWNVMAYMAAAKGCLIKTLRGLPLEAMTAETYKTRANAQLAKYLGELEMEGYAPDEVCLAYLMNQKLLTIPVVSFSKMQQLQSALRSCEMKLPEGIMNRLEELRGIK